MPAQDVPILFLIFNRPDLTARVFERIREIRPQCLYIAADGPRESKPEELELCRRTRNVVAEIDWPCQVYRRYQNSNLGCKIGVSSAISWFFENAEEGIILEDDILPDPTFYRFAAEMLERYRDDERIATINGASFGVSRTCPPHSYYVSRYPMIWGWATWRRTWNQYDREMGNWPASKKAIFPRFISTAAASVFFSAFDNAKAGKVDTWDYQLNYSIFLNNRFSISPVHNLVENIGFDERATHTDRGSSPTNEFPIVPLAFPLVHPSSLSLNPDTDADMQIEARFFTSARPRFWNILAKARRAGSRLLKHSFAP